MKTLKTAFLSTLAAFGMSGGLYADAYTFTAGTAIPLKENDAQASWVTINNFELQNDYQVGNKQGTSSITLTLNNTSAGDYVLCFDGCNQSKAADLTISASGSSGYSRSAVITQVKTADWSTFRESFFLLDDLPVGEFTFTLSAKQQGSSTSWSGTYKNFTIKNLSGNALDMAESSGSAFAVKDQSYVKVLKNAGNLTLGDYSVGSTRNDDSVQFSLFSANATGSAKYSFSFDVATNDNYPTVTWRLIGPGVDRTFSDTMPSTGNWNNYTNCVYNLGVLPNGAYTLTMTVNSSYWAGNYKNFTFTTGGTKTVTAADGLTLAVDEDWTYTIVTIEDGAVIDLHGCDLIVDSATTFSGKATFTNSLDEAGNLSTLSIDYSKLSVSTFGGNLKVVQTGTASSALDMSADTYGANTHTGGTELSNMHELKVRSPNQFGTGAISLAGNAKISLSQGGDSANNWAQDWHVANSANYVYLGYNSWQSNYTLSGAFKGDGAIDLSSGWQASITLTGDLSAFQGTFNCSLLKNDSGRGLWLNPGATVQNPGLPNANVVMANPGSNSSYPQNRLFIQKSGDVEFGSLATEIDENNNETYYSVVYAATQGVNLKVGAKADATYTGRFAEHNSGTLSIEKVGADTTWTLTSTNHNFSGAFVVSAGKVVFNNADKVALGTGVTVGANGTIGGSGTITSPITFTSGAKVEVAAGGDTLTFSSDIDASTLTVKLTGDLNVSQEYTILKAGSGSSGRAVAMETDATYTKGVWRTKWVASGDTKILKGYYVKSGLVIIFK